MGNTHSDAQPGRIGELQGAVARVRVRLTGLVHRRIHLDELPRAGVVVTSPQIHEPRVRVHPVPRIPERRRHPRTRGHPPVRVVGDRTDIVSDIIGNQPNRTNQVAVQVLDITRRRVHLSERRRRRRRPRTAQVAVATMGQQLSARDQPDPRVSRWATASPRAQGPRGTVRCLAVAEFERSQQFRNLRIRDLPVDEVAEFVKARHRLDDHLLARPILDIE